jgi:hypothetical protein
MFEDLLTAAHGACFAGLRLGELRRIPGGIAIPVMQPRFCLNVDREHTSSRVFLWVTERGFVTQRCHCRKHGCDRFRSCPLSMGIQLFRACGLRLPFTFRDSEGAQMEGTVKKKCCTACCFCLSAGARAHYC